MAVQNVCDVTFLERVNAMDKIDMVVCKLFKYFCLNVTFVAFSEIST